MKGTNSLDMDMKGVKDVFGQAMELPFPEASRGRQGFLGMFRLNFQAEMSRRQLNALIWNQGRELVWGNISKKKKKKEKNRDTLSANYFQKVSFSGISLFSLAT